MARAYIGESGSDRAMNKMIKHMERNERREQRNGPAKGEDNSIMAQLKAAYPTTWRQELEEMTLEHNNPEYLEAKRAYRERAKAEYYAIPRAERQTNGISESTYVARAMEKWRQENRAKYANQ